MSDNNTLIKMQIRTNAQARTVRNFLCNDEKASKLFSSPVNIRSSKQGNKLTKFARILGCVFEIKYEENSICLTNRDCTAELRLRGIEEGSIIELSIVGENARAFPVTRDKAADFLGRLKSFTERDERIEAGELLLESEDEGKRKLVEKVTKSKDKAKDKASRLVSGIKDYEGLTRVLTTLVILGFLAVAVYVGGRFVFPLIYDGPTVSVAAYSEKVSLENASLLEAGMSQSEVERIFGITGEKIAGGTLYSSKTLLGDGRAAEQVLIEYEKHIIKTATYLNLNSATKYIDKSFSGKGVYPTEMTPSGISEAAAMPISMLRWYMDDSREKMLEVHFGYVDPYANFDRAWRGQFVVTENVDKATLSSKGWVVYGAGDGLLFGSLEGNAISNQYDSYTDYLEDKFNFDYMMIMRDKYTKGDVKSFFGAEPKLYYDGTETNGTMLYSLESGALSANDQTPLYKMSFGYDALAGHYRMCSFVNMRLVDKRGMLDGTRYETASKGMSYNEIRGLMGIVPTAIYMDETCYTVCYGHYIDDSSADDQFEVEVRISFIDDIVQDVFNNVARAQAIDEQSK